jgi:3-keto-L-gulonate-6-phosphate decarboxylase
MMTNLQLARATPDGNEASKLAAVTEPYVNILEVGGQLIKSAGINIVTKLQAAYSDKTVLADLKSSSRYIREIWFE